ncbi:MAG: Crp/Fnr family transcriptional regulator [Elusimicrobiota bacterium]
MLKLFRDTPPFSRLPAQECAALARRAQEKVFQDKEVVFNEGARAGSGWLVFSGRVRVVSYYKQAQQMQLELLAKGQLFGVFCRVGSESGVYPCTAVADGKLVALRIPDAVFWELLRRHPEACRETCRLCAERLSLMQRLVGLGRESAEFRVADVLYRNFLVHGAKVHLTRQNIALQIGATIETVFRVLAALRRQGWIETARGSILIKDPAAIAGYVRRRKGR